MKNRIPPDDGNTAHRECGSCEHTVNKEGMRNMVVCIPHLKTIPASNFMVCKLYSVKKK